MKIFHNEEIYIKTDNFSDSIFKENTMFFDIETTGFSPVKAIVYMIVLQPDKLPAKASITAASSSTDSAKYWSITIRFLMRLAQPIISFNGVGYDIPFLKNKYKKYKQDDPFCNVQILDIFKELSPIKPLLRLENYKQKSIEAFFTVFVVDICCDTLVYGHVLLWKIVVVFVIAVEMAHFPLEYLCTHIAFCSAYGQI